jgi:hypothetical protein
MTATVDQLERRHSLRTNELTIPAAWSYRPLAAAGIGPAPGAASAAPTPGTEPGTVPQEPRDVPPGPSNVPAPPVSPPPTDYPPLEL